MLLELIQLRQSRSYARALYSVGSLLLVWIFGLPFLFLLGLGPYNMSPGDSADWALGSAAIATAAIFTALFVKIILVELTPTPTPKAQPLQPGDKDKR